QTNPRPVPDPGLPHPIAPSSHHRISYQLPSTPTKIPPPMAYINDNYLKLKAGYLFPEINRRVNAFAATHPQAKIIRMGIGDVTEPLPTAITQAMHAAVDEMGQRESFHGYGPEQGYDF